MSERARAFQFSDAGGRHLARCAPAGGSWHSERWSGREREREREQEREREISKSSARTRVFNMHRGAVTAQACGTKHEGAMRSQTAESPATPLDFLLPRNPLYPCEHLRSPGIIVRASPWPSRAPYTFCQGTPSPGSGFRVQGLGFEVEG